MKHTVVSHLYALAAFGNTLGVVWVIKEAWERHVIYYYGHWIALLLLYVFCFAIVDTLRRHQRWKSKRRKRRHAA